MARTLLTKTTRPGGYSGNGTEVNYQVGDAINGNKFKASGNDLVLVKNDDTVAHTFSITSTDDKYGRTEDVSESIAAGKTKAYGPLPVHGWMQSDGHIYTDCDDVNIEIAIVSL